MSCKFEPLVKSEVVKHTDTQVGIDAGITSSTSKVLVFAVRDVKVRLRVTVFLGQSEVDDIDLVATLPDTHQEVVGLDVTMDKGLGMNIFDAGD